MKTSTKELMILHLALYYTLQLQTKDIEDLDIRKLKNALLLPLKHTAKKQQDEALDAIQTLIPSLGITEKFDMYIFVLILLMNYKEKIKGKVYSLNLSYSYLNEIYDKALVTTFKDEKASQILKSSTDIAERVFEAIMSL